MQRVIQKITGVYKITNPKGKIYIGSSVDIKSRFAYYKSNLAKNQPLLNRSFLKYGVNNHTFEIIKECEFNDLYKFERIYGDLYKCIDKKYGLNIKLPGYNDIKCSISNELRNKFSEIAKKRKYSNDTIQKFRMAKLGKKSVNGFNKIVLNLENGVFYDSISEAAKTHSIKRCTLSCKLRLYGNYVNNNTYLCLV